MNYEIVVEKLPPGVLNDTHTKALMPAGEYFVGDNGYIASANREAWAEWIEVAAKGSDGFSLPIAGACYNDFLIIGANTAYGDGIYTDNKNNRYSVDSGMIGLTPRALLEKLAVDITFFTTLGVFMNFSDPVELSFETGTIFLKTANETIEIPTGATA